MVGDWKTLNAERNPCLCRNHKWEQHCLFSVAWDGESSKVSLLFLLEHPRGSQLFPGMTWHTAVEQWMYTWEHRACWWGPRLFFSLRQRCDLKGKDKTRSITSRMHYLFRHWNESALIHKREHLENEPLVVGWKLNARDGNHCGLVTVIIVGTAGGEKINKSSSPSLIVVRLQKC